MSKELRSTTLLFPISTTMLLFLALLATGNCNACGCGPTRDYVGDMIDASKGGEPAASHPMTGE